MSIGAEKNKKRETRGNTFPHFFFYYFFWVNRFVAVNSFYLYGIKALKRDSLVDKKTDI